MISLVFSNSYLYGAQWIRTNNQSIITAFSSIPFIQPLSATITDEADLTALVSTALHKLIEDLPLESNDVAVAINDDFLFHDIIDLDHDLSGDDARDYISWSWQQRFGDKVDNFSLFIQTYSETPFQYFSLVCPRALIDVLRLSITELGATPVWLGTFATTLLDTGLEDHTAVIFEKQNQYLLFIRTNNELTAGKIRFSSGEMKIVSAIGNPETFTRIITRSENTEKRNPFLLVDRLSDKKLKQWQPFDFKCISPFTNINMEGVTILEEIPDLELNVLSAMITGQAPVISVNLFNVDKIHKVRARETAIDHEKKKAESAALKTLPNSDKKNVHNRFRLLVYALIIIIVGFLIVTRIGDDNNGINISEGTNLVENMSDYSATMLRAINESYTRLKVAEGLLGSTDNNHIRSITIVNQIVSLEFHEKDSIVFSYNHNEEIQYLNKQQSENNLYYGKFDFSIIRAPIYDKWIVRDSVISILQNSDTDVNIREFQPVTTGSVIYTPLIIGVDSFNGTLKLIQELVKVVADNILVRKIEIRYQPESEVFRSSFYLSVLK